MLTYVIIREVFPMILKELLEKGSLELKINNINEPKIKARLKK